jgi:hypothetical protein
MVISRRAQPRSLNVSHGRLVVKPKPCRDCSFRVPAGARVCANPGWLFRKATEAKSPGILGAPCELDARCFESDDVFFAVEAALAVDRRLLVSVAPGWLGGTSSIGRQVTFGEGGTGPDRFETPGFAVCKRRNVTAHHLQVRSAGGSDGARNLTSPCAWCHLHGIHGGRRRATRGTAV